MLALSCAGNTRNAELSSTVRIRILDAAQSIIDTQGLSQLTQPKVAKAAGIRQSHLTYYFPRRVDLLSALLEYSHQRAATSTAGGSFLDSLVGLLFDASKARFFLAVVVETSETADGQAATAAHMAHFVAHLGSHFRRSAQDAAIQALAAELRGLSLENLVAPKSPEEARALIGQAIARHGLADAEIL